MVDKGKKVVKVPEAGQWPDKVGERSGFECTCAGR